VLLLSIHVLFLDTDSVVLPGFIASISHIIPSSLSFTIKTSSAAAVVSSPSAAATLSSRGLLDLSISCDNVVGPQTNPAFSIWRASEGSLNLIHEWRQLELTSSAFGDMRGIKMMLRGGSRYVEGVKYGTHAF
jgi:hypothetical protein